MNPQTRGDRKRGPKRLLILVSRLTKTPRYYATCAYTVRENGTVIVTGKKHDITEQIEAIVDERRRCTCPNTQCPVHMAVEGDI